MATRAEAPLSAMIKQILEDLAPFPGRAAITWRVALICTLVSGIAMLFHIPEAAISVYLVIYLMKPDGAENTVVTLAAIIAITILVALMVPLLQATIESTVVRILVMIVVSFIFIFIGAATKLGEGGSIVALIIAFILSLISSIPINGVISTALRFAWEMSVLPMFVMAGFCLFFGQWSVSLLRQQLRERLVLARELLTTRNHATYKKLNAFLSAGNEDSAKKLMLTKILHQTSKKNTAQIAVDIPASYQLVYASAALSGQDAETERAYYAQNIDQMIDALDKGEPLSSKLSLEVTPQNSPSSVIHQAIEAIAGLKRPQFAKGSNDSFIAPDAFTNPDYQQFALKTTLAAMLCYMFYAAIDWNGIHTAMVTCYVASLGTTGDTIHKLALRITGCLIGALMGVISLLYILPHMQNIGALMLVVFAATWVGGWVAAGNVRISYAGVQIGLAFTLTVLQGFGPTTSLDTARDRIIGILVGNFAVYLVSVFIWPKPVKMIARDSLIKATNKLADIASTPPAERLENIEHIAEIEQILDEVRYCYYLLPYEPDQLRPSKQVARTGLFYAERLSKLARAIYFSDTNMPEISGRLSRLANHLQGDSLVREKHRTPRAEFVGNYPNKLIAEELDSLELSVTGNIL